MPLFSFECEDCHSIFELLINNDITPMCSNCKSKNVKKYISKPFFKVIGGERAVKSTPTVKDLPKDSPQLCARVAHYADRNTGKSLGYSQPEVVTR